MDELMDDEDPTALDLDGDGVIDAEVRTDPVTGGSIMVADTDGDGVIDTEVWTDASTGASTLMADSDGDGIIDTAAADEDGDGLFESVAVDTDGDGLVDAVGTDTDRDGVADSWETATGPADGTGQQTPEQQTPEQQTPEQSPPDQTSTFAWPETDSVEPTATAPSGTTPLDLDADGVDESALIVDEASGVTVLVSDTDADGVVDLALADVESDGVFDTGAVDLDADGQVDAVGTDTDGDGLMDEWEPVDVATEPVSEPMTEPVSEPVPDLAGEPVPDLVTEPEPETEPAADVDRSELEGGFWQAQTENGFCGPTSVAIILAEVYGVDVDAQELVDLTIDNGWMIGSPGAWEGMQIADTEKLMEEYGVAATTITPENATEAWALLEQLTTDGNHGVIAYIDSSEVWDQVDDDLADGLGVDHAVVVTHVDDHYVYLNDPGIEDGQQLRVDRNEFMDAWDDSGHSALVTDEPSPMTSGSAPMQGEATDATSADATTSLVVDGAGAVTTAPAGSSPLDLATLDGTDDVAPWRTSPDTDLLTAALPGLRVAILPVVLGAGALVAVAASRRRQG